MLAKMYDIWEILHLNTSLAKRRNTKRATCRVEDASLLSSLNTPIHIQGIKPKDKNSHMIYRRTTIGVHTKRKASSKAIQDGCMYL